MTYKNKCEIDHEIWASLQDNLCLAFFDQASINQACYDATAC